MKYKNRLYCDDCGKRIKEAMRIYELGIDSSEDRCIGSSGVDILQIENEIMDKGDFYYILSDPLAYFCEDCCSSWQNMAIEFEHKVRATRARVLTKILDNPPKPKPPEEVDEFGLTRSEWLKLNKIKDATVKKLITSLNNKLITSLNKAKENV